MPPGLETFLPMVEIKASCYKLIQKLASLQLHHLIQAFSWQNNCKDTKISCCWLSGLIHLHIHNSVPPLIANTYLGSCGCFLIAGRRPMCVFSKLKPDGGEFCSLASDFSHLILLKTKPASVSGAYSLWRSLTAGMQIASRTGIYK